MHLSTLRSSQIYLSSVIVTTVSSGTLACSTVALSLCGVKCVCVCVCVPSHRRLHYLHPGIQNIFVDHAHLLPSTTQTPNHNSHKHTPSSSTFSTQSVCVCVCIPVLWKAFSPLHSLMITHTHTHSWGYVQAVDVIITAAKLFWLTVWFPDRRASVVNRGRGPALLVQL